MLRKAVRWTDATCQFDARRYAHHLKTFPAREIEG
jgi:hypothetical protein